MPTNAELFRANNGPTLLTLVGGGESAEVWLQQLTCGGYRYTAQLDLEPNTAYEVFQYDPPQLLTSFVTGDGPDEVAPAVPAIDELWFGVDDAEDHGDCGGRTQINLAVDAPGATTLAITRDTALGGGCDMVVFPEETGNFGTPYGEECRVFTKLDAGQEYCWDVRARDLAGNESEPVRQCATVLLCQSADGEWNLTDCDLPAVVEGDHGCMISDDETPLQPALLFAAGAGLLVLRRRRRA